MLLARLDQEACYPEYAILDRGHERWIKSALFAQS